MSEDPIHKLRIAFCELHRDPETKMLDIKWLDLFEAIRAQAQGEILEAVEPLVKAAEGLSFGTDWNNGTHAKLHGYRQKLLDSLKDFQRFKEGLK